MLNNSNNNETYLQGYKQAFLEMIEYLNNQKTFGVQNNFQTQIDYHDLKIFIEIIYHIDYFFKFSKKYLTLLPSFGLWRA